MPEMQKGEMRRWNKAGRGRIGDDRALLRSAVLHHGAEVPGVPEPHGGPDDGAVASRSAAAHRWVSMCGECWSLMRRARLRKTGALTMHL
jgi:hypothetical protein